MPLGWRGATAVVVVSEATDNDNEQTAGQTA
jgi:hypothetical protein